MKRAFLTVALKIGFCGLISAAEPNWSHIKAVFESNVPALAEEKTAAGELASSGEAGIKKISEWLPTATQTSFRFWIYDAMGWYTYVNTCSLSQSARDVLLKDSNNQWLSVSADFVLRRHPDIADPALCQLPDDLRDVLPGLNMDAIQGIVSAYRTFQNDSGSQLLVGKFVSMVESADFRKAGPGEQKKWLRAFLDDRAHKTQADIDKAVPQ